MDLNLKQKANPREQLLGIVAILAVVVMFFRVIYLPKRDAARQRKTQIQNLTLEKEALKKFTEALVQATQKSLSQKAREQKGVADVPTKIRVLRGELPPVADKTAPLLALLTSPRFTQGITVRSMSDLPPKKENNYEKSSFFINVQGSFPQVLRYVERIEEVPALTMIDNVSLKTIDTKGTEVELELNGTLFQWEKKNGAANQ